MDRYVYVAGPISSDPLGNTHLALRVGAELMRVGFHPFIPHLSVLWQMVEPRPYEEWMKWDFAWIKRCDALLRLYGESPGADREVAFAKEQGIPVFYSMADLLAWPRAWAEGAR
jgi:hypothetical protein